MQRLTPLKAIRLNCVKCAGGASEVRKCDYEDCPLFRYRLGHNPARRGIGGGLRNFKSKSPHSSGQIFKKKGIAEGDASDIIIATGGAL